MAKQSLSAAFIRSAKPGRYCDGDGLYLLVRKSGNRFWVFRYKVSGGKPREAGLGRAGDGRNCVKLSDARDRASTLFRQVKAGIDPLAVRDAAKAAHRAAEQDAAIRRISFREAAYRYLEGHSASWKNPKHARQWESTLETYVHPVFGDIPVGDISTVHVLAALEPIWLAKPETASRLRGRIETVLDFAKARGWRIGENPAIWKGHLSLTLPAKSKVAKVKHHAALPWREVGCFMQELSKQAGMGALALIFAILTAARSGEVRGARWEEIDLAASVWRIPGARMKTGKEHRVPLSQPAMELLNKMLAARSTDGPDELVFPGQDGTRPLSDMSLTAVLRRMGRADLTAHGFRSTFRDWAAEATGYPADVAEISLAHTVGNKVEAAYRRGDLFEKRCRLMADWAHYCGTPRFTEKANVVALREAIG